MRSRNIFTIVAIATICLGIGIGVSKFDRSSPPMASLSVDKSVVDLGVVPISSVKDSVFNIVNVGSVRAHVKVESISCNCTDANLTNEFVEPGHSVQLLTSIRVPDESDDFGAQILLSSNDPARSHFALKIQGKSAPVIICKPSVLYFGDLNAVDLPRSSEVRLSKGMLATSSTLQNLVVSTDDRDAIGMDVERTNEEVIVKVTLKPEVDTGVYRKSLKVKVSDPAQEIYIPIVADVVGRCHVTPSGFLFGHIADKLPVTKQCELSGIAPDSKVVIQFDSSYANRLKVSVRADEAGKSIMIATITPLVDDSTPINGEIKLTLNSTTGHTEHLAIPIVALFY